MSRPGIIVVASAARKQREYSFQEVVSALELAGVRPSQGGCNQDTSEHSSLMGGGEMDSGNLIALIARVEAGEEDAIRELREYEKVLRIMVRARLPQKFRLSSIRWISSRLSGKMCFESSARILGVCQILERYASSWRSWCETRSSRNIGDSPGPGNTIFLARNLYTSAEGTATCRVR